MNRRELFSSLTSSFSSKKKENENNIIRPPYFDNIDVFDKGCLECDGKCATFCEEQIIVIDINKTPILNFAKSGCTYCDECAKVCEFYVLNIEYKKQINFKVEINIVNCLSWNQTMCFACKEPCLEDAIEFLGMFRPKINSEKCTSCGFCLSKCPSDAIIFKS